MAILKKGGVRPQVPPTNTTRPSERPVVWPITQPPAGAQRDERTVEAQALCMLVGAREAERDTARRELAEALARETKLREVLFIVQWAIKAAWDRAATGGDAQDVLTTLCLTGSYEYQPDTVLDRRIDLTLTAPTDRAALDDK